MARKRILNATFGGSVNQVFTALGMTLAFRRWPRSISQAVHAPLPDPGYRYRYQAGSVRREGRVVEVIRPVSVSLKEFLHDSPCCVALTLRWRIDSLSSGVIVSQSVSYRLNRAAALRARHWDRRLLMHCQKQLTFLSRNLEIVQRIQPAVENDAKRDLLHSR